MHRALLLSLVAAASCLVASAQPTYDLSHRVKVGDTVGYRDIATFAVPGHEEPLRIARFKTEKVIASRPRAHVWEVRIVDVLLEGPTELVLAHAAAAEKDRGSVVRQVRLLDNTLVAVIEGGVERTVLEFEGHDLRAVQIGQAWAETVEANGVAYVRSQKLEKVQKDGLTLVARVTVHVTPPPTPLRGTLQGTRSIDLRTGLDVRVESKVSLSFGDKLVEGDVVRQQLPLFILNDLVARKEIGI